MEGNVVSVSFLIGLIMGFLLGTHCELRWRQEVKKKEEKKDERV